MAFYHLLVYLVNKGFYGEMDYMNCSFEIIGLWELDGLNGYTEKIRDKDAKYSSQ